jgi:glycosyltransferase involved in cell wall biosynthesis
VVNLVHHIHREQWPEVFGPLRARFGWWLESRLAPRVYRRCRYLVVSRATRDELVALGVEETRVEVTYSGREPVPDIGAPQRSAAPSLVVLGRLVPHKRVELAIRAVARLRKRYPGLTLQVVGQGYWRAELERCADELGVTDAVMFTGFIDELDKHRLLATSWLHVLPSLKEGWGLAIVEAGAQGTASIAFRDARGTTESVVDGETGILVDGEDGFVAAIERLLGDEELRQRLGRSAQAFASGFSWATTTRDVESMLYDAAGRSSRSHPAEQQRAERGAQRES